MLHQGNAGSRSLYRSFSPAGHLKRNGLPHFLEPIFPHQLTNSPLKARWYSTLSSVSPFAGGDDSPTCHFKRDGPTHFHTLFRLLLCRRGRLANLPLQAQWPYTLPHFLPSPPLQAGTNRQLATSSAMVLHTFRHLLLCRRGRLATSDAIVSHTFRLLQANELERGTFLHFLLCRRGRLATSGAIVSHTFQAGHFPPSPSLQAGGNDSPRQAQ